MEQSTARQLAHKLQGAGIPAIADNLGGWSGGPRSQIWGVRNPNLSKVYTTMETLPPSWADAVKEPPGA